MKAIRTCLNLILTALIGFLLPSCHTQKGAAKETKSVDAEKPVQIEESSHRQMRVLYGIPPEVYKMREEREKAAQKDSTAVE